MGHHYSGNQVMTTESSNDYKQLKGKTNKQATKKLPRK